MAEAQPVLIARAFKGVNRIVAPHMLDETQSPDAADAAQWNDISTKLGPRRGRLKAFVNALNIRGVVPLNLSWGRIRIVSDSGGNLVPNAVPWPAGPSAPAGGFCSCDVSTLGSANTGNISPGGSFAVAFTFAATNAIPGTTKMGIQDSHAFNTNFLGWNVAQTLYNGTQNQNAGTVFGSASPDSLFIQGFLTNLIPSQNYIAGLSGSKSGVILLTRMDDNVIINGVSGSRGSAVVIGPFTPSTNFTIGS